PLFLAERLAIGHAALRRAGVKTSARVSLVMRANDGLLSREQCPSVERAGAGRVPEGRATGSLRSVQVSGRELGRGGLRPQLGEPDVDVCRMASSRRANRRR